jgi:adenylosuccinate synthase
MGVGETVEDAHAYPEISVSAGDINQPTLLRQKLRTIRDLKREQILAFCKELSFDPTHTQEFSAFAMDDLIERWMVAIAPIRDLGLVVSDSAMGDWFRDANNVVFEGAQGVLLDANAGFHPYTTWSRCTTANALELIGQTPPNADISTIGVLRSYAVRHGPGPLPTETGDLTRLISEHNQRNDWQGTVRYGWFDCALARYALKATGGVDALAITHLDILPRLEIWKYSPGYHGMGGLDWKPSSLNEQMQITQALSNATPIIHETSTEDETVIREIEGALGTKVGFTSHGPTAENVRMINS